METKTAYVEHLAWDLTKATLTSLALMGIAGCGQPPAKPEPLHPLQTTPAEVVRRGVEWEGREVTIHANPRFVADRSNVLANSRASSATVNVELHYSVAIDRDEEAGFELPLIHSKHLPIADARVALDGSYGKQYMIPENANVITGTVQRASDGLGVYVELKHAAFDDGKFEHSGSGFLRSPSAEAPAAGARGGR